MEVNVLGTIYTIVGKTRQEDHWLETCDAYTDPSTKIIVVNSDESTMDFGNPEQYKKTLLRHEIIHAFFYESGLDQNSHWDRVGNVPHPEQTVEWFAVQFPKILKAYQEADAL